MTTIRIKLGSGYTGLSTSAGHSVNFARLGWFRYEATCAEHGSLGVRWTIGSAGKLASAHLANPSIGVTFHA